MKRRCARVRLEIKQGSVKAIAQRRSARGSISNLAQVEVAAREKTQAGRKEALALAIKELLEGE